MNAYRIEHYLTPGEQDLYLDWLRRLRDSQAKVAVIRRVARVELGNFGDHKFCRDGVWELRIDVGPGYRVYYAGLVNGWCYCCAAATSGRRMRTSPGRWATGRTGNGDRMMRSRPHVDAM